MAGFPELSVFDQLSHYVKFMHKDRLLAEIYRPAAESMMGHGREVISDGVALGVQQAGKELVEARNVSQGTMDTIHQPILTSKNGGFHSMGNLFWKTCIAEGVTPKEFEKKGMIPRPDSIESFMAILKIGFNPEGTTDINAIMQFCFSGSVEGDCFFTIDNESVGAEEGRHSTPTITIRAPFDVWMDIMTGKADGQEMFFQEKYKVEGDFDLMMKMGELFGSK